MSKNVTLIGKKIKQLRKDNELNQKELAELLGVSHSTIGVWETGQYEPSIFNCIVLADFFNVSLDELCCREFKGGDTK